MEHTSPEVLGAKSNVVREVQTKRQHVRVQMPSAVVLDGVKYDVADWSLGGFGLEGVEKNYTKGGQVKAALSFLFHGYAFTIVIPCEVVFVSNDGSEVGCRFEEITADQNELIRYLINAHLSGRIGTIDGILTAAANRNIPAPKVVNQTVPLSFKEKMMLRARKGSRYLAFGAVGSALLTLIYLSAYARFFTVSSEFAAVTAQVVQMRTAGDGWVEMNRLNLGDRVPKGDLLYRIRQPALEGEIAVMRSTLAREQTQLGVFNAQAASLGLFFENYKDLSNTELENAEASFEEAKISADVAQRQFDRIEKLRKEGFASVQGLDNARNSLSNARTALAQAKSGFETARINTNFVDQGYYYTGSRVEGEEPEKIAGLVAISEKNVALYTASLNALLGEQEAMTQLSPCDCVVQDLRASDGEFLEQGSDVIVLQKQSDGQVTVEAKVPHTSLASLEIGGEAEVLFADDQNVVKGTIIDISHFRQSKIYSGLPDFVGDNPNFGTILVSAPRDGGVDSLGLPLQVRLPISLRNKAFSVFGVDIGA